jgi:putative transcriptional regulator
VSKSKGREQSHVSRAVFARRLRVRVRLRTLEKREQGRANPDAQASALMLMGRKFPDTLEKPGSLENQAIE